MKKQPLPWLDEIFRQVPDLELPAVDPIPVPEVIDSDFGAFTEVVIDRAMRGEES